MSWMMHCKNSDTWQVLLKVEMTVRVFPKTKGHYHFVMSPAAIIILAIYHSTPPSLLLSDGSILLPLIYLRTCGIQILVFFACLTLNSTCPDTSIIMPTQNWYHSIAFRPLLSYDHISSGGIYLQVSSYSNTCVFLGIFHSFAPTAHTQESDHLI